MYKYTMMKCCFLSLIPSIITIAKEEKPEPVLIPGIFLETNTSAICSEVSLESIDNFILCFYLQLKKETSNMGNKNTIISILEFSNSKFELEYEHNDGFTISFKEQTRSYHKPLEFNDWIWICVTISNGNEIKFEVNSKIAKNHKSSDDKIEQFQSTPVTYEVTSSTEKTSLWTSSIKMILLCMGATDDDKTSIVGSLVGTTLHEKDSEVLCIAKDACFNNTYNITSDVFTAVRKNITGKVREELYDLNEVCWMSNTYFVLEASKFNDFSATCRRVNGQLVRAEELLIFSTQLKQIFSVGSKATRYQDPRGNQYTWLDDDVQASGVDCSAFDFVHEKFVRKPCEVELDYSICKVSKYSDFSYYGSLNKYDKYFTLHVKNESLYLKGKGGTILEKEDDHWTLRSEFHKQFLTLHNVSVPIGRYKWKNSDGNIETILTFTSCLANEFTCSNGDCLPEIFRCNGKSECLDESDEEKCVFISKSKGYSTKKVPRAKVNEPKFKISYSVLVNSVSDISLIDRIAKVDLAVQFTWYDPGLGFHNFLYSEEVDCKEIWSPRLSVTDGIWNHTKINFETYFSGCFLNYESHEVPQMQRLQKDPFNDKFESGENLPITYLYLGMIPVSCRFNFKKYPFGEHTFNIAIWIINAIFARSDYTLASLHPEETDTEFVEYRGQEDLGEFNLESISHCIELENTTIYLAFKVKSLFGYHVVNSFIPSILIFIISYSSLYFPSIDFNERIMVSLTSLLVLAALFTQASNTSVRTSYFKLLDIWFVSLIAFCFFIVIANVLVHKTRRQKIHQLIDDEACDAEESLKIIQQHIKFEIVEKVNTFAKFAFASLFSIFIFLFSLAAAEII